MNRWLRRSLLAFAALIGLAATAACGVIGPRNLLGIHRYDQREEGSLRVGDAAPDVALVALDGATSVHLGERMAGKTTVLNLGSFT